MNFFQVELLVQEREREQRGNGSHNFVSQSNLKGLFLGKNKKIWCSRASPARI